jgi:hypothetical protein
MDALRTSVGSLCFCLLFAYYAIASNIDLGLHLMVDMCFRSGQDEDERSRDLEGPRVTRHQNLRSALWLLSGP